MDKTASGWINGLLGVAIFSGSLPATRVAVADFDPLFLTVDPRCDRRACLGFACCWSCSSRSARLAPTLIPLAIVALGVVVGFPLLTALALQYVTAAHSIVFVGLLPLATAIFGVLRGGERPRPAFWLFSGLGQCARRRLRADAGRVRFADRRRLDACCHHRLRTWLR